MLIWKHSILHQIYVLKIRSTQTPSSLLIGFGPHILPLTLKILVGNPAMMPYQLATKLRLNKFYNRVPSQCFFCDSLDEDVNHIFFKCNYILRIFSSIEEHDLFNTQNNNLVTGSFNDNIFFTRRHSSNFVLLYPVVHLEPPPSEQNYI